MINPLAVMCLPKHSVLAGVIVTTHLFQTSATASITFYTLQNNGPSSHNGTAGLYDHSHTARNSLI